MKTIYGDLILKEDTTFDEGIKVECSIKGYYNLKVRGNINCRDIDCRNINCLDIVFCDKIKVSGKVKCKVLIKDRFSLEQKEWEIK
jgi:cytoskeletal protein CcmA (bactofilin family)